MSNCYMFRHRLPSTGSLAGPEIIYEMHRPHWNDCIINTVHYVHVASTNSQCCDNETLQAQFVFRLEFAHKHVSPVVQSFQHSLDSLTVPSNLPEHKAEFACTDVARLFQHSVLTTAALHPGRYTTCWISTSLLRPVLSTSQVVSYVTCNNLHFFIFLWIKQKPRIFIFLLCCVQTDLHSLFCP
jgi:hypothetical protein